MQKYQATPTGWHRNDRVLISALQSGHQPRREDRLQLTAMILAGLSSPSQEIIVSKDDAMQK